MVVAAFTPSHTARASSHSSCTSSPATASFSSTNPKPHSTPVRPPHPHPRHPPPLQRRPVPHLHPLPRPPRLPRRTDLLLRRRPPSRDRLRRHRSAPDCSPLHQRPRQLPGRTLPGDALPVRRTRQAVALNKSKKIHHNTPPKNQQNTLSSPQNANTRASIEQSRGV
jgi:hypothetical protein